MFYLNIFLQYVRHENMNVLTAMYLGIVFFAIKTEHHILLVNLLD